MQEWQTVAKKQTLKLNNNLFCFPVDRSLPPTHLMLSMFHNVTINCFVKTESHCSYLLSCYGSGSFSLYSSFVLEIVMLWVMDCKWHRRVYLSNFVCHIV